ncbi:MAG: lytic transglycosylase domain-containing protein [Proteobacteria bacterium]|nr:lytic transglycosylase domain-containing protein [Pseudomonadota bacterium]
MKACSLTVCLLLLSVSSLADIKTQRPLFKTLYKAALAGNEQLLKQQRSKLSGYPLEHYLDYALLTRKMTQLPKPEIDLFIQNNTNSPLNKRLRHMYLYELGKQKKWSKYLKNYSGPGKGTKQCRYLQARIETGKTQGLASQVQSMWLSGLSAPDACNPAFKWWIKQDHQTQDLILRRIKLAFEENNFSLAGYLKTQLKNKPVWINQAISLMKTPMETLKQSLGWSKSADTQWLLQKTALKMASKKPAELHQIWPQLKARFNFNKAKTDIIEREIALFASTDYLPFSIKSLNQLPAGMKDDQIKAWIVRFHLYHQDWPAVLASLMNMSSTQLSRDRWQYWLARAYAKTGDKAQAEIIFEKLHRKTNYFGFLSADHLRFPYHLCQKDSIIDTSYVPPIAIIRSIELFHAGLMGMARGEWNKSYRGLNKKQKLSLAEILYQEQWYTKVILVLADTAEWENYIKRYPIAHLNDIQKHSSKYQLLPQWILSIIRQESGFAKDAISKANAHGLMQLLPATAKRLSKQLGLDFHHQTQLHHAPFNIQLGVHYQYNLFKRFNHPLLVAAAYNAGERKSDDWLVNFPTVPDIWLETIPYQETRQYITRILAYVTVYDWLVNSKPKRISYWMPTLPVNQQSSKPWPSKSVSQQTTETKCPK